MKILALAAALSVLAAPAFAAPVVGEAAPAFTGVTASGETISLADYAGETVVLEWTNDGCPFVQKHYGAGNMQTMQADAAEDGIVWISVISSAPGKQGHLEGDAALALNAERGAAPAHILLDPEGDVGTAYGAKTTPHIYVIDGEGTLRYAGGIDDRPSADPASLEGATNYVELALADLAAGRDVATPAAKPYGCSVKYK